MGTDLDRSAVGRSLGEQTFPPVSSEAIRAYAAASGEIHPWFTDDAAARQGPYGTIVAPPTFSLTLHAQVLRPEQMPTFGGRSFFDAGKEMEFGEPIRPGDVLTASTVIHEVYEKTGRSGSMIFAVIRTTLANQDGRMAAVIDQRMMFR